MSEDEQKKLLQQLKKLDALKKEDKWYNRLIQLAREKARSDEQLTIQDVKLRTGSTDVRKLGLLKEYIRKKRLTKGLLDDIRSVGGGGRSVDGGASRSAGGGGANRSLDKHRHKTTKQEKIQILRKKFTERVINVYDLAQIVEKNPGATMSELEHLIQYFIQIAGDLQDLERRFQKIKNPSPDEFIHPGATGGAARTGDDRFQKLRQKLKPLKQKFPTIANDFLQSFIENHPQASVQDLQRLIRPENEDIVAISHPLQLPLPPPRNTSLQRIRQLINRFPDKYPDQLARFYLQNKTDHLDVLIEKLQQSSLLRKYNQLKKNFPDADPTDLDIFILRNKYDSVKDLIRKWQQLPEECPVCLDDKLKKDMHTMECCNGRICKDCLETTSRTLQQEQNKYKDLLQKNRRIRGLEGQQLQQFNRLRLIFSPAGRQKPARQIAACPFCRAPLSS